MKVLNVLFSESQKLKIDDIAELHNVKPSVVARAAMLIGLMQLTGLSSKDLEAAKDLIMVSDARAK